MAARRRRRSRAGGGAQRVPKDPAARSRDRGAPGADAGYRATLQLPVTDFPMRADLPRREPEMQRAWAASDLYARIRAARRGAPRFIFHDGPPYVNGNIHMGTALNKSLKDFVVRFHTLLGEDAPNVPGWDTHGLPVEMQALRVHGLDRASTGALELRRRCREFALSFRDTMTAQFARLGILADWSHPYFTLDPGFEAAEIAVFGQMASSGLIYRGLRPVYWCTECTTALAEAEVEFREHVSPAVTALFSVTDGRGRLPAGTSAAIWTTTPWTLPANVAITAHPELEYVVVAGGRGPVLCAAAAVGRLFDLAPEMRPPGAPEVLCRLPGRDLEGVVCAHPFLERAVPLVLADYVEAGEGTGLVHTAPGHGPDDFEVGRRWGLPVIQPLDQHGIFGPEGGPLTGLRHTDANGRVIALLREAGRLWHAGEIRHEYAHCWRCKQPVIWRATEQWFCRLDAFREQAVEAARAVSWHPGWGEERMAGMLRSRGDWCLSRQRAWGVPIPVLHCTACAAPLLLPAVFARIAEIVGAEGSDAWWIRPGSDFLPEGCACPRCGGRDVRKDPDTLDVWFDSGTTHAAVLARDPALGWPADLYLEGPDQFRGWFQSSLLTAVATRGRAPYRGVVCHGWVLDGQGRAMHKSLGNTIEPSDLLDRWGADVLRLWAASADYTSDVRVSPEIMAGVGETYRKIRNTLRFLLGCLHAFAPAPTAEEEVAGLPERDRFVLHRLGGLEAAARAAYGGHRYNAVVRAVTDFCVQVLSGFYLDVAKDRLYCAAPDAPERRGTQRACHEVVRTLVLILAPLLPHTADEAWGHAPRRPGDPDSVHLRLWTAVPTVPWDAAEEARWTAVLRLREAAARQVEAAIAAGTIGRAAEAVVEAALPPPERAALTPLGEELADLLLVAAVRLRDTEGAEAVAVRRTADPRCPRCWRHRPAAGPDGLCARCAEALSAAGPGTRG